MDDTLKEEVIKILPDFEKNKIITGTVVRFNEYGVYVRIAKHINGFLKNEDISNNPKIKAENKFKINDKINVKIIKVWKTNNFIGFNLSQKKIKEENVKEISQIYKINELIEGTITKIEPTGFLHLTLPTGYKAYIPAYEISWVKYHAYNFKINDKIKAIITEFTKTGAMLASYKRAIHNPYETFLTDFPINSQAIVKVKKIKDYGFIVSLNNGIKGLLHNKSCNGKELKLNINDEINVIIESYDPITQKLSLKLPEST